MIPQSTANRHQSCKTLTVSLTLRGRQPSGALRRAYGLCAQLMHFFHQTLLYMTFEVAEPAWRRFQAALAAAGTVDQVCSAALKGRC